MSRKVTEIEHGLTKELVVLSAYDMTNPTRPASTVLVMRVTIESELANKIIVAPTNSRRRASQRLTEVLGKKQTVLRSMRRSFTETKVCCRPNARIVDRPVRDSPNQENRGDRDTALRRCNSLEVAK